MFQTMIGHVTYSVQGIRYEHTCSIQYTAYGTCRAIQRLVLRLTHKALSDAICGAARPTYHVRYERQHVRRSMPTLNPPGGT